MPSSLSGTEEPSNRISVPLQWTDASQAEAQRFFTVNGGPTADPHRLDRDRDGIACEAI